MKGCFKISRSMTRQHNQPLSEKTVHKAELHLSKSDPVMKRLIAEHGSCPIAQWEYHPFHTLVISIISQQLSAKAANTIEKRIAAIVSAPFQPAELLSVPVESLRSAGLSRPKARYIHELAQRISEERLSFSDVESEEDDAVIEVLIESPGIGRWTAEMFLIFGLKRLDVLSLGDAGLQRAARILYGDDKEHTKLLASIADVWRPYRSVASWYLWKSLDG
jgi:DNA-3-methyladenine glycosylase II